MSLTPRHATSMQAGCPPNREQGATHPDNPMQLARIPKISQWTLHSLESLANQ